MLPSSDSDETEKFYIFRNDVASSNDIRLDSLDKGTLTSKTLDSFTVTIKDSVLVDDQGKGFIFFSQNIKYYMRSLLN